MRILAVTNMYPTRRYPTSGTFVEQQIEGLRSIGVEVEVLLFDRLGQGIGAYVGLPKLVRGSLKQFQPDVVHVMYGGVMADLVTQTIRDRPVLVSFCGSDLLGEPFLGFLRRLSAWFGVAASHRAGKRADGIVVKSQNLREALPNCVDLRRVWIIPNGVNLNRFRPLDKFASRSKLGWNGDCFHVLFPSYRGHTRKRIELAEAAMAKLKHDGIRVTLHQLNGVPHEQVPVWLNAADALILTSIHEGSPNIIKEALACNRPIVSTNAGDVRERINEIQGCYLARLDAEDLARGLRLVFDGPGRVAGREKMEDLSLERVAERLRQVYMKLLNRVGGESV